MTAFEQLDAAPAKTSNDTGFGALQSDAYSNQVLKFDSKSPPAKDDDKLPGLEIVGGDKLDLAKLLPEEQHKEDLRKYDKNGNKKLDDDELQKAMDSAQTLDEMVRFADLKKYDTNRDGVIDEKEDKKRQDDNWKAHLERLKKYDTNHDGTIDDQEQKKEIEDFVAKYLKDTDEKKKPLKEKELKEETARGVEDLKKGIASGDLSAVITDLERAKAEMPADQYAKYLKAVNEEFHKHNPNADIVGTIQQNGKHQMEVRSKSGDITVIVDNNEVDLALGVRNIF